MLTSQAIIADGKGKFSYEDIEVFPPGEDEVLVEVKASGICHTDYDSVMHWEGPFIVGHEGAGVVLEVGEKVSHLKVGDRVILNWAIPCGSCFQCLQGQTNICERNSPVVHGGKWNAGHADLDRTRFRDEGILRSFNLGTMAQHTVVKAAAAIPFDTNISFAPASIIGCGVMTGVGSVLNTAKVERGASVVVIGVGGVGLNIIQGAKISGAEQIIAVDRSAHRLQLSEEFGSTYQVKVDDGEHVLDKVKAEVWQLTGRGADYAFECTGVPALGAAPLMMVRNAGMAVQVSGIEQDLTIDMNLFEWDKIYINPLYGKCDPTKDFPQILEFYDQGRLKLDELISKEYSPRDLHAAFDDMLNGRIAKGVITF
ncbi:MAG: alcohol dehydrogenase catalytic domain-containing protein [Saprospiraceae bacterium]|nr:alcohol dehydrogenase catalytic domain-containing protein [Saprospiraceae bacterium]